MLGAIGRVVVGRREALHLRDRSSRAGRGRSAPTAAGVAAAATTGGRRPRVALQSSFGVSVFDRYIRSTTVALERMPKDLFLAAAVGIVQLCGTLMIGHNQEGRESIDALAVALLLAGPAALYWRARAPVAVMIATLAPGLAYWALDYPRGPIWIAAIVAFVSAVFMGRRVPAWILLGVAWAGLVFLPHLVSDASPATVGKAIGIAVWLFLLGEFAEIARSKRERHLEQQRAEREQAAAQAGRERLLIARELHDVLAHNVSLINVQAGVALHLLDEQPERARPALEAIKDASSETLREMRSVLDILRKPGEQPPRSPTAGVGGLDELIARTKAAGIAVDARVSGSPRGLPASVDLAVYRIVQEALTNVARHAHPAAALVQLAYADDSVEIVVEDDGLRARQLNGYGGNGIAGMRERVAALGGEFSAGPRPDVGFRVRARLPLDGEQ
jgi:signal transduction histidine kinase